MTTPDDVIHDSPAEEHTPATGRDPDPAPEEDHREPGSGVPRAMIPVARLAAHPGNVRRDLDLSPEFIESIKVNGVLVALRITPDGDGYRVIDGGRRLAGALKAGMGEVPCDLAGERAGDEACQYLDMINMNRHRNPLTTLEEADALFAAREAGATKTRIRKAAGLTSAGLGNALAACCTTTARTSPRRCTPSVPAAGSCSARGTCSRRCTTWSRPGSWRSGRTASSASTPRRGTRAPGTARTRCSLPRCPRAGSRCRSPPRSCTTSCCRCTW